MIIKFPEVAGDGVVDRRVDAEATGKVDEVKELPLDFAFVTCFQVFLQRGGAFGVEAVNHFEMMLHEVASEVDSKLASH